MSEGFDSPTNRIAPSDDGTFTAYSVLFDEHYHSTKDGALNESLKKHVIPALSLQAGKEELTILDICFGLGFNTLATLYYIKLQGLSMKVRIVSPEMDGELVRSLKHFTYPTEFGDLLSVVSAVSDTLHYEDAQFRVEVVVGDARDYLKRCDERFDVVYQDAFSPGTNPMLWTREYFTEIARAMADDGVLTTYSTALKTRLALHENGFNVYVNSGKGYRNATVASKRELSGWERVDMAHKIGCNPDVSPLCDDEVRS